MTDFAKYKKPIVRRCTQCEIDLVNVGWIEKVIEIDQLEKADLIILVNEEKNYADVWKDRIGWYGVAAVIKGKEYIKLLLRLTS